MADMGDVSDLGLNFDAQIAQSLGESSQLDNFMPDSVLSNHNSLVLDLNPQEEDPLGVSEVHEEAPVEDLLAVHSSPGIALEAPVEDLGAMVDMDDLTSLSGPPKISDDKPEDTAESEALGEDAIAELTSINLDSDVPTQKVEEEPVFDDDLSNIGADVASSSVLADANIPDSAKVQILKKYAGLKEK